MSHTPMKGAVTEFSFSYPHPQLYFDVKDDSGNVQHWGSEFGPTPLIMKNMHAGWTRESIKPGDEVVITCNPHKVPGATACLAKSSSSTARSSPWAAGMRKRASSSWLIMTTPGIRFCAGVLLFALAPVARAQPNPPPPGPPPKLVKIKDDLYMIENSNANLADLGAYGGNVTVYLTSEGVILVDSKFDRNHDDVAAKIKSLTSQPVKYLILTHNHADHAGGAAKMEAMGATVLISADDRDNMLRAPNQTWLPQVGYIGQARVTVGGKEVQLSQLRGHTRGDTVVYFPAARVVAAGDLVTTADAIPLIVNYADGGNWTDWSKSIDEILKLDFDVLIPGHGPMIGKPQLLEIRNKMVAVRERVRVLNREKKTQEEIGQTVMKEFNWGMGPSAGNIPGMMQELR